ncbi:MAG TPA: FAD-dependent oxidoreductase [Dehalococcoidia bacterium]|nr:FAD-dependent oxidoreductase [Dehalococcoidia bacterium]
MKSFDLIVIGSGSGLEVSSEAADRGLSVAVVEPGPFGGTCLNRGCIPSKMLIHSADVVETIRRADLFGISAEVSAIDWEFIVKRVADTIGADAEMVERGNRDSPNITVFKTSARFVGPKRLDVGGEEITAETIVVAAGTRPRIPNIEGLTDVPFITSDEALRLPTQPRRLVIYGGGFIAAELAHFFGALGTDVTILYRGSRLLRKEDDDVATRFTEVYGRRFNTVLNATIENVCRQGDEIVVETASDGVTRSITTDALLLATGRVPNTDTLEVAESGVTVDANGFVKTDEYLETEIPGIWALGDIVGRYLLKHSANLEAAHVAHNVFSPESKVAVDYHAMPQAVFASPQVGSVGLTEREANERGIPYAVGRYDYIDTAYGSSIEDKDGFVKVLVHRETREVLGGHIIGSEASILVQEIANAMRLRLTTDAFAQAIYVHPALPEVVQRAFGAIS